jgi:hypothetical protein
VFVPTNLDSETRIIVTRKQEMVGKKEAFYEWRVPLTTQRTWDKRVEVLW